LEHSIERMPRAVRRRLTHVVRKDRDGDYRRRANALLLLHEGLAVSETARLLLTSRKSVREWRARYQRFGEAGLVLQGRGRQATTVTEELCAKVLELVEREPKEHGYLHSRWTSELLAECLKALMGVDIHASTIRRLLPELGVVWNRARPTLCIRDPKKAQKMRAIDRALEAAGVNDPVFYVDEADVDLNPRIGFGWMKKGKQTAVPTPGKNQKRYLAGALHAQTGQVVWVEWHAKNAELFVLLLAELCKRYRRARSITLIADNYVIHKSAMTECFLRHHPKLRILFQPAYHPWVNKIELLWKKLHDTVTRNHRYATMAQLMDAVRSFMNQIAPFPGNHVLVA
jgi:transposase